MEVYKFTGIKLINFNSSVTTGIIDSNVSEINATITNLSRYSLSFTIKAFNIYAKINSFLESPLSFSQQSDTDLEKWYKDRELIKRFSSIGLNFSLNNNPMFSTFVTGSTHPYDFTILKEIPLSENQSITCNLENKGHGLLTADDIVVVSCPYELIVMGI